MEDNEI